MITVTGATGHLGRHVVNALISSHQVPAGEIVAAVRSPEKAADLGERGVQVRQADYNKPETLSAAFAGTHKLLLISSSEVGQRVTQHENAVRAAVAAGVSLIVYTSILKGDASSLALAAEHKATEAIVRDSGLPYVFLRNSWYIENYTENLGTALQYGAIFGAAKDGKISGATRADFAAAAAAVLTTEGHAGKAYELGGTAFTMTELAAEVSAQSGKAIAYRNLPAEEYAKLLIDAGVPEPYANALADSDVGVSRGELYTESGDLQRLIGRSSTPLADAVAVAVKAA